jgi:CDP-4-dehydro-6-deoxyglucose reductase
MAVGDEVRARGPLGAFTIRSIADVPLLFVAGGTGYAPIHALIAQQARFQPRRDMVLIWGMRAATQFYALDDLAAIMAQAPGLRVVLAAEAGTASPPAGMQLVQGTVLNALAMSDQASADLTARRDIYAAGPPMLLRGLVDHFGKIGIDAARLHVDSFGV